LKLIKKIIVLALLILIDFTIIGEINLQKIEWNAFLPKSNLELSKIESSLTDRDKQYLFCHIKSKQKLQELQTSVGLDKCIALTYPADTYILLFDANKMDEVLAKTSMFEKSGTILLGKLFFNDFYDELYTYSIKILPFILILLLFFIPLRLWVDILLEMAIYTLLLVSVLRLGYFEINSASLLSILFLIIYSLTLINYLYSENMHKKRLFFGIQVSIIATMISAFFLLQSQFGLIHSFGLMLFIGLVILHIYMNIRIYFLKYFNHREHIHNFNSGPIRKIIKKYKVAFFIILLFFISLTLVLHKNLAIDLNIVNTMNNSSKGVLNIEKFEKKYIGSLPFIIEVNANKSNFSDVALVNKLITLQEDLQKDFEGGIIESIPNSFEHFKAMAVDKNDTNLLAQFLLANSFMKKSIELFSSDMSSTIIIASIPLTLSSDKIIKMKQNLHTLNERYPEFSLKIKGKVADFDNYLKIFLQETAIGLFVTLLLSALFFLFYCKNFFSAIVVFLSVIFSLTVLLSFHILFNKPLSILTLMSIILYAGLVADSFIQLFICYKSKDEKCEKSILNPIFISNASIVVFLFGMIFIGGIIGSFAFDMSILLSANLLFILLIVPWIYKYYIKVYSE